MGLHAIVGCDCLLRGLPVPEQFRPYLYTDLDGGVVVCLTDEASPCHQREFETWWETACPHYDMEFAAVDISTWGGVSHLRRALEALGGERYPTLLQALPVTNSGYLAPRKVPLLLTELDRFEAAVVGWQSGAAVGPRWWCRAAQSGREKGRPLSEPKASLGLPPPGRAAQGSRFGRKAAKTTATVGSSFLWLLSFGEAKESNSPAGEKVPGSSTKLPPGRQRMSGWLPESLRSYQHHRSEGKAHRGFGTNCHQTANFCDNHRLSPNIKRENSTNTPAAATRRQHRE